MDPLSFFVLNGASNNLLHSIEEQHKTIDTTMPVFTVSIGQTIPSDVQSQDVFVVVRTNQEGCDKDKALYKSLELKLAENLHQHADFAKSEDSAKYVLNVELLHALSTGIRVSRLLWRSSVHLSLGFTFFNNTEKTCPILKYGSVTYDKEEPLKAYSLKERCQIASSDSALVSAFPEIAKQLCRETQPNPW